VLSNRRNCGASRFLGAASETAPGSIWRVEGLREGLRALGHVEGKNMTIEFRWAEGKYECLPALAAELVRSKVDVIVTYGTPGALAVRKSTTTIPIVLAVVGDPVLPNRRADRGEVDAKIVSMTAMVAYRL
jgi:putative ABC transport system substrate-binding protein